jgi:hypothetical protein
LFVPVTVALKAAVPPFATLAVGGFTLTRVTVGTSEVTLTDAVPFFVASTVEVALTVKDSAPSSAATAKMPPALMLVPAPPPSTDQLTLWAGLLVPLTVALKVWVPPFSTLMLEGSTLTTETVGLLLPGSVTVTAAVPLFVASTVERALTVKALATSPAATERTPLTLMFVPLEPPSTVQVTL